MLPPAPPRLSTITCWPSCSRQLREQRPRESVGAAAGGERHDDRDRFGRPRLAVCRCRARWRRTARGQARAEVFASIVSPVVAPPVTMSVTAGCTILGDGADERHSHSIEATFSRALRTDRRDQPEPLRPRLVAPLRRRGRRRQPDRRRRPLRHLARRGEQAHRRARAALRRAAAAARPARRDRDRRRPDRAPPCDRGDRAARAAGAGRRRPAVRRQRAPAPVGQPVGVRRLPARAARPLCERYPNVRIDLEDALSEDACARCRRASPSWP